MAKVTTNMSISLDGFAAGPNDSVDGLHDWLYELSSWRERHGLDGGTSDVDAEVLDEAFRNVGALVMGRRMFDLGEQPWGDEPPFHMPVFVVTHRAREPKVCKGGTTFTFVTEGFEAAVPQAREAAGERDVAVAGGPDVIQQALNAGLLDEIQVHVVPLLLGDGQRLFDNLRARVELERIRVVEAPSGVTHLRYRVVQ